MEPETTDKTAEERNAEIKAKLDQTHRDLADHQEKVLVYDFDEALAEHKRKRKVHVVKMFGEEFEVPASMPMGIAMLMARNTTKDGFRVPNTELVNYFSSVLPPALRDRLGTSDVDVDFVANTVVDELLKFWGLQMRRPEDAEGNGETHAS